MKFYEATRGDLRRGFASLGVLGRGFGGKIGENHSPVQKSNEGSLMMRLDSDLPVDEVGGAGYGGASDDGDRELEHGRDTADSHATDRAVEIGVGTGFDNHVYAAADDSRTDHGKLHVRGAYVHEVGNGSYRCLVGTKAFHTRNEDHVIASSDDARYVECLEHDWFVPASSLAISVDAKSIAEIGRRLEI